MSLTRISTSQIGNVASITANVTSLAQASFNTANNSLPLAGGTITGSLTVNQTANVLTSIQVGGGGFQVLPNLIAQFTGVSSLYSQVNQQNLSANGTGDFVVTASNGSDTINYIDMCIAGATYNNTTYNAYPVVNPNDGYLISVGNPGQNYGGNIILGTAGSGSGTTVVGDIVFVQGQNFTEVGRFALNKGLKVSANVYANGVYDNGIELLSFANAAFNQANSVNTNITSVTNLAQAAYNSSNTTLTYAQSAFALANTSNTNIVSLFAIENTQNTNITSANNLAQAAFNKANTALANTSGAVFAGNLTVTGSITSNTLFPNYVGIGTNSPTAPLHVISGDVIVGGTTQRQSTMIRALEVGTTGNNAGISFGSNGAKGSVYGASGVGGLNLVGGSPGQINFGYSAGDTSLYSNYNSLGIWNTNGLGIGTTNPSSALQVVGTITANNIINNSGGQYAQYVPQYYAPPMYTYYYGGNYYNSPVKIGNIGTTGGQFVMGRIIRSADFNYAANKVLIEFAITVYINSQYNLATKEIYGLTSNSYLAVQGNGDIFYYDANLWEQYLEIEIYSSAGFTWSGTLTQDYSTTSRLWKQINAGATQYWEHQSWGT